MKAWAPIYEFTDLLDEIGMNKRQFPRSTIDGKVRVKLGTHEIEGQLLMISEGGFGADQLENISIGQTLQVELVSDAFYEPIPVKVDVRYITEAGYVGFRFQNLSMENRSAIIQYVRSSTKTAIRAA